jgi:hypothetical protein
MAASGRARPSTAPVPRFRLVHPSAPSTVTVTVDPRVNKSRTPSNPLVNVDRTDRSETATRSGRLGAKSARQRELAATRWQSVRRRKVPDDRSARRRPIGSIRPHPRLTTTDGSEGRGLLDDHAATKALGAAGRWICPRIPIVRGIPANQATKSPGHTNEFTLDRPGFLRIESKLSLNGLVNVRCGFWIQGAFRGHQGVVSLNSRCHPRSASGWTAPVGARGSPPPGCP